jgi:hypothetical protein
MGTLSWPEVILVCFTATALGAAGIALYIGPTVTLKWLQSKFRRQ